MPAGQTTVRVGTAVRPPSLSSLLVLPFGGIAITALDRRFAVANLGPESFEAFEIPWAWGTEATERGAPLRDGDIDLSPDEELARLDLAPHQVRVLLT